MVDEDAAPRPVRGNSAVNTTSITLDRPKLWNCGLAQASFQPVKGELCISVAKQAAAPKRAVAFLQHAVAEMLGDYE